MSGRSPSGPGSRRSGRASKAVSPADAASIPNADFIAARLSDEAILVAFGWFSFGAKASVTSNPPHANMKARQAALAELKKANLITHEHEYHKRYGIDRHHFKGTHAVMDVLHTVRGRAVLASAIEAATAGETTKIGSTEGESATRKGDAQGSGQGVSGND